MPYSRRRFGKKRFGHKRFHGRSMKSFKSRRGVVPRLGRYLQNSMRMQHQGIDMKVVEINQILSWSVTFTAGNPFASLQVLPLNEVYSAPGGATNFNQAVGNLFNEWRLKKASYNIRLGSMVAGAGPSTMLDANNPLEVGYSWQRNINYAVSPIVFTPANSAVPAIVSEPEFRIKDLYAGSAWQIYTSIIASQNGGEGTWLNTSAAPAAAPNITKFFCPTLGVQLGCTPAQLLTQVTFTVLAKYIIEARGSKM